MFKCISSVFKNGSQLFFNKQKVGYSTNKTKREFKMYCINHFYTFGIAGKLVLVVPHNIWAKTLLINKIVVFFYMSYFGYPIGFNKR